MSDNSYMPKVYRRQGGDVMVVASGGQILVESGGGIIFPNPNGATDYYVDAQNGLAANDGLSWGTPFAAFSSLDTLLDHGDRIFFTGAYKGNWTAPNKNDVTLIGCGNTPRQATSDGVANGGGATWLSLASPAASPLLKILGQGWTVANIFFNNSDTTMPDVWLHRNESLGQDASHAYIVGCKFTGTDDGIKQSGGVSFVKIIGCTFFNFAATGDIAISSETGTGDGTGLNWEIAGCMFHDNVHNIVIPLNVANIHDNVFVKVGHAVTSTSIINLNGGAHNMIHDNAFGHVAVASPNDTLYVAGTADIWSNNKCSDGVRYEKPDES